MSKFLLRMNLSRVVHGRGMQQTLGLESKKKNTKWPRGHCCEALICIKGVLGIYSVIGGANH